MQRRTFITLTAFGGTATVFSELQCNPRQPTFYADLERPGQLSYICDEQAIREIGIAYRLQKPEENEARKLEDILLTDSAGNLLSANMNDQMVRALLSKKVEEDFEKSITVMVKGWILSVTEARQCALFAVHNQ